MDDDEVTQYITDNLCSLVIPADESVAPYAIANTQYTFNYNLTKATMTVSGSDLRLGENVVSFESEPMRFKEFVANNGSGYYRTFSAGTGKLNNSQTVVNEISGFETTLFYYYPTAIPGVIGVSAIDRRMAVDFNVGDEYEVKTFPRDMYFGGETTTHYAFGGEQKSYVDNGTIFRVYFNDALTKATVVMYNANFAEEMPKLKAIALQNLTVTFSAAGYRIQGKNVVPQVYEGGGVTDYQNFTFDNFTFYSSSSDLVDAECSFKVAGRFQGQFSGCYARYGVE